MSPAFKSLLALIVTGWLGRPAVVNAGDSADAEEAILKLHKTDTLYDKARYKTVRAAFARLFESKHAAAIRQAYGEHHAELSAWLEKHPDLKENLYTAIDDRFDKVPAALALFRELWKKSPKELAKYADLGIATAVTWDDPRAIYEYRGHQLRTKSKMPDGLVDGLGNFQYVVENDKATEGRGRYLPWEFLIFVVDHKTPVEERRWAQQYYQQRKGAKSWHADVPYDHGMLKAEKAKDTTAIPRLAGKEYTLANLKSYGGVCAHQADFACRVAKSVAIPAVYCSGESSFRGRHAWWMYVQLQSAKTDALQFTLNSDGRFVGFIKDAFYTGQVTDPQTGKQILDRDMERRLALVGRDRNGKRHVDLLMRAYPWLADKLDWDQKQRVAFLDKCVRLSPQHDEPWSALATLIQTSELPQAQKGIVRTHLSSAMSHFKNYPDALWRVYRELLVVYEPAEQVKLAQQAVTQFEKVGRPDLACDARLKITDFLTTQKKFQLAAEGLITTIYRFPTEGRYVPKMTQKLQGVTPHYKGGTDRLAQIYLDLVPKLAAYYKNDDEGSFQQVLYRQALEFFERNDMPKQAQQLKLKVGKR